MTRCPECGVGEIVQDDERGVYCDHCGHEPGAAAVAERAEPGAEPTPTFELEDAETFAAVDEPGADPLVVTGSGCVIPVGGFVLVYGDGGAGKTTLCLDWAVHWAAGESWLDVLEPARPLRVVVVENEGPRPEFRRKLRRRLEAWGEPLDGRFQVLAEPWATLTLREPGHRAALARQLAEVDLVVAGPLSALGTEGGGTLDEIRGFTDLMADVRELAEHPVAFLLVHHENRAGQVSGAWEGAPDMLVHVQAEGHGRTRVFWQKVRWSSDLHKTTTRLVWADGDSFTIEERDEITEATMADEMLAAAREVAGGSWRAIRERVRGNASEAAAVRDRLLEDGLLVNRPARKGGFNLWAADDPAAIGSEAGTTPEPLRFFSPEREAVEGSVPGSGLIGNREQNHNHRPGSTSALEDEIRQAAERAR